MKSIVRTLIRVTYGVYFALFGIHFGHEVDFNTQDVQNLSHLDHLSILSVVQTTRHHMLG
jgi:hypothetical protein